ncbi:MAG: AAA family ATPase [Armatimonadetes bacterium]|nr:AAA family ATPase [Armatimonadota bacterium]
MKRPSVLFVAGTGQHSGKTLVSLGLVMEALANGHDVRYMKPVGQRTVDMGGEAVDEDVALINTVCHLPTRPRSANPVTIPSGYTRKFLVDGGDTAQLRQAILDAFEEVSAGADVVVVEGTGHAGVGSVIGLSNADVAQMLGAEVVLVTGGGIGRPIDEFCLNEALFARSGVRIFGVVCNKVMPDKLEYVREPIAKWMAAHGVRLLGLIPFEPLLTEITVGQIAEETGADIISGEEHLDCRIRRVIVGAEPPHRFLEAYGPGVMALIPGDRDDLVLAAVSAHHVSRGEPNSAVCLTSGILPHPSVLEIVRATAIPVIAVKDGMFAAASRISDMVAKMQSSEHEKVQKAHQLIKQHFDFSALQAVLGY